VTSVRDPLGPRLGPRPVQRFPEELRRGGLDELAALSRELRRDRELAFDGAEDLTPGEFYGRADADRARAAARTVVETVAPFVPTDRPETL